MSKGLIRQSEDTVRAHLARLPALGNDEKRLMKLIGEVYQDFIGTDQALRDLAIKHAVPADMVLSWARAGKWVERRETFRNELMVNLELDYAKFVKDNRTATANQILEALGPKLNVLADALGEAAEAHDSVGVRRYAEATKAIADVVTKIVGLDMSLTPASFAKEEQAGAAGGKPPWVINAAGPVSIAPANRVKEEPDERSETQTGTPPKTIDVDAE